MSHPAAPALVWFRSDLRLADNPAVDAAVANGRPILALYVLDEALEDRPPGAAARWWLDGSLRALSGALKAKGVELVLRRGDSEAVVPQTAKEAGVADVFWNRLYASGPAARDARVKAKLEREGVAVRTFNGSLLAEPGSVLTGAGEPYRVFSPFQRALAQRLGRPTLSRPPAHLPAASHNLASDRIDDWSLRPTSPDWAKGFRDWRPGEAGGLGRLESFVTQDLGGYEKKRNRPDLDSTSRLSPHLRFGEISPWRVLTTVHDAAEAGDAAHGSADKFSGELFWREFNHHLLAAFPDLARKPMRPRFESFPWRKDRPGFEAWSRGRTGYPLVDAGMRQLWATGWMHNRVRMVAASFLVKHLMIDWREGEAWFWDTLVDADPANNPANWQWAAGCGMDAAPYFRIFNPLTQAEKFDPRGEYMRRWAGIDEPDYPAPIVDHREARARALEAAGSGVG